MCWSCGCGELSEKHSPVAIDTSDMEAAAKDAGTDVPHVVSNIMLGLLQFDGRMEKVQAHPTNYAACRVVKASDERRYTLGVAYPAMKADPRRAADGHRDFVSPEVLEKTAWEWMAKHRDINLFHQDKTSGHGTVVESYIYRGPDWEQPSPVDGKPYLVKSGDWLLGAVWDDYGWTLVKAGLVNGWSPEGSARRHTPDPERLAQLRSR